MNEIAQKGLDGEQALNKWLNDNGLSYLYIDQKSETFSRLFSKSLKRPDFLILLESIGLIAVDAKNYQFSGGVYTLNMENEFQKALTFERIFRIPLWYAYLGYEDDQEVWYWISALKAIEVGEVRTNRKRGDNFLAIKREHFETITCNNDLGKLYTHRLPKIEKIAAYSPTENSLIEIENKSNPLDDTDAIFEHHYGFSYDYNSETTKKIISSLHSNIEFSITHRRGEDRYFSTSENKIDHQIVALIDKLSNDILQKLDFYTHPVTIFAKDSSESLGFAIDHLIYAVSSVFYDDKCGSSYEIRIDDEKLTPVALELIDGLRKDRYSISIGYGFSEDNHHAGWALFATLS